MTPSAFLDGAGTGRHNMIKLVRPTRATLSGIIMHPASRTRPCLPPYETRKPEFGGAIGRPHAG
jgi:hypothetical protein